MYCEYISNRTTEQMLDSVLKKLKHEPYRGHKNEEKRKTFLSEEEYVYIYDHLSEFAYAAEGLDEHQIESALKIAIKRQEKITPYIFRDYRVEDDINKVYVRSSHSFEDVGGFEFLKEWARRNVLSPDTKKDVRILLAGPSGSGKTWFVEGLAGESYKPIFNMEHAYIHSRYAQREGIKYDLFWEDVKEIRLSKMPIYFEEIGTNISGVNFHIHYILNVTKNRHYEDFVDALKRHPEGKCLKIIRRFFNYEKEKKISNFEAEYLQEWMLHGFMSMPSKEQVVIGDVRHIREFPTEGLDLWHFNKIFYMSPPSYEDRLEILKIHGLKLSKPKVPYEDSFFEKINEVIPIVYPAVIVSLLSETGHIARLEKAQVIKFEHFQEALDTRYSEEIRGRIIDDIRNDIEYLESLPSEYIDKNSIKYADHVINEFE